MRTTISGIRPYLLLGLVCLVLYVPGISSLPPVDRDEARFAQATRQMLETGDLVRIRFQDEPRHKKPAGIYWLQAAAVSLFSDADGTAVWPYRLPSLIGAIGAVWLTFALGQALFDRRTAFVGATLLAASLLLAVEARMAKTDAMLLATVVAAQGALARIYVAARAGRAGSLGAVVTFWAALGVGMLIKGPIAPMVAATTLVALKLADRPVALVRSLRPLLGIPLAAAIFLPWVVAISGATGGSFVGDAVRSDLLPKLLSGQEAHGFPPGYYLLLLTITFWPGSLLVWHGLAWAWRQRAEVAIRFCLAWIVPAWLIFELVPTKLPHYVLPLYPALALLAGRVAVATAEQVVPRLVTWDGRLAYVAWALVGLALAAAVVALPPAADGGADALSFVAAAAAAGAAVLGALRAWQGRAGAAVAAGIAGAAVVYAVTFGTVLPRVDGIWISRQAAAMVRRHADGPVRIAATGYHEPSLVFLLGTATALVDASGAAARLRDDRADLALVAGEQAPPFLAAAGDGVRSLGTVRGYNYSKGRWVDLTLYGRAGADN